MFNSVESIRSVGGRDAQEQKYRFSFQNFIQILGHGPLRREAFRNGAPSLHRSSGGGVFIAGSGEEGSRASKHPARISLSKLTHDFTSVPPPPPPLDILHYTPIVLHPILDVIMLLYMHFYSFYFLLYSYFHILNYKPRELMIFICILSTDGFIFPNFFFFTVTCTHRTN